MNINLNDYDFVIVNTSGGKDSQAMTDYLYRLAEKQNAHHKLVMVHADLGRVEWKGTRKLIEKHSVHYDIPLFVVNRENGDLLDQVEKRGMWPDARNRYCTSDQKRAPISKLITMLVNTARNKHGRPARILNCLGFRADESPARAKREVFSKDDRLTNSRRTVNVWLPIHTWTVEQVWECIKKSGVTHHYAYDLGMPRLSCCFCIFAPTSALRLAGKHNPELLAEYVRIEKKINHSFKHKLKLETIQNELDSGVEAGPIQNWTM